MNQIKPKKIFLAFLLIFTILTVQSQSNNPTLKEWQDHKFSMFIHWGLYSIPAGFWNGQKIDRYSEQLQGHARISNEEYGKLASKFNPVKWNADSVALLAKKAGMKSIIITSKHHDGFSMFHTKYSEYNVLDATPYKRDVIKELSESCKEYGLKFGIYFSLIDWNFPGALPFSSTKNSDSIPPLHHDFNLHQVGELMSNYGDISEIWFDMGSPTFQQSKELRDLIKKLQPNCLINGRLWNNQGDFAVMGDNSLPKTKMGVPWQTPASMFDETWGYRSWQERGNVDEKVIDKIEDLIKVVSLGGNYLLNIGPTGDGDIVPFEKEVLIKMGIWVRENGEAIYETKASQLPSQNWGYITQKPGKIYLHVFKFSKDNKLVINGLEAVINKVYLLNQHEQQFKFSKKKNAISIDLNLKNTDQLPKVLVIDYQGELILKHSILVKPSGKGQYQLTAANAEKYYSYSGHDYYSNRPVVVKMGWNIPATKATNCKIKLYYTPKDSDKELKLKVNGKDYSITLPILTKQTENNQMIYELDNIELPANQQITIRLSNKEEYPAKALELDEVKILVRIN
jgi:alpha-L-fucosidase